MGVVLAYLVEGLAVVDADDRSDHLGDDDHVAKVGAHGLGLLAGGSVLQDAMNGPLVFCPMRVLFGQALA